MDSVDHAFAAAMVKLSTPRLTRTLQDAIERQQPPRAGLVRPKLRYAHQGGRRTRRSSSSTASALAARAGRRTSATWNDFFAEAFKLRGTPLRIQFKTGVNPYAGASRGRG